MKGMEHSRVLPMVGKTDFELWATVVGRCHSLLAADNLQKMGYTNVLSMAGGWRDWCARGLPRE